MLSVLDVFCTVSSAGEREAEAEAEAEREGQENAKEPIA